MATTNEVFAIAVSREEAESDAANYDTYETLEEVVAEMMKLRQPRGSKNAHPYKIFRVVETFSVISEVEIVAKDKE